MQDAIHMYHFPYC